MIDWFSRYRIILSAVERYIRNVAEDVRDIQANINENGKSLLDVVNNTQEHYKWAKRWHTQTKNEIRQLHDNVSGNFQAIKKLHCNIEDDIHQVAIDIHQHSSEAKIRGKRKTLQYLFDISHFRSWQIRLTRMT